MNWFTTRKLSTQILLSMCITITISILLVSGVGGFFSGKIILEQGQKHQKEIAEHYGAIINSQMNLPVDRAQVLSRTFTESINSGMSDQAYMERLIFSVVDDLDYIRSMHVYFVPGVLDLDNGVTFGINYENGSFLPGAMNENYGPTGMKLINQAIEAQKTIIDEPRVYRSEKLENPDYTQNTEGIEPFYERKYMHNFVSVPVVDRLTGASYGAFLFEYDLNKYHEMMSKIELPEKSYITIITANGLIAAANTKTALGIDIKKLSEPLYAAIMPFVTEGKTGESNAVTPVKGMEITLHNYSTPLTIKGSEANWSVMVSVPEIIVIMEALKAIAIAAAVGTIMILAGALSGLLTGKRLSRPINMLTEVMKEITEGNLNVDLKKTSARNEIGRMTDSVFVFLENARNLEEMKSDQEKADIKAAAEKRQMIEDLANNLENSVKSAVNELTSSAEDFRSANNDLSGNLKEVTGLSDEAVVQTEDASTSVNTVASACQELSASISEIAGQVSKSAEKASATSGSARESSGIVHNLEEAADSIGDAVKIISDIAEQTNLLALNATIEAARAGEAGKGFAVVAGEVKNLASQTAKATKAIGDQVGEIQRQSALTSSAMNNIAMDIDDIASVSASIAAAVEEQSAATDEISRNVTIASQSVTTIQNKMENVKSANTASNEASDNVEMATEAVVMQTAILDESLEEFLQKLRTDNK